MTGSETEPFRPVAVVRRLLREARAVTLATLARRTGHPFGSLVTIGCEPDGTPVLLLSTLAAHSRNLAADPRASLLVVDRMAGDPQTTPRVTVVGRIERIADDAVARRRHLARNPDAALYAGFADFAYHRLVVEDCHLVAGFGRAVRVAAEDALIDGTAAGALVAAEPELVAELAADPRRVGGWAERVGGRPGSWTVIGLDPEGLDLVGSGTENLDFRRISLPGPSLDPASFIVNLHNWENTVPSSGRE